MLIAILFTKAKLWKQPKCPQTDDEQMKNMWGMCMYLYIHTHNGILLSHRKE